MTLSQGLALRRFDFPAGEVRCLAFEISDTVVLEASRAEGFCPAHDPTSVDLCRKGNTRTASDGAVARCLGDEEHPLEENALVFFSTRSAPKAPRPWALRAFVSPVRGGGLPLTAPLRFPEDSGRHMRFDGKVDGYGLGCDVWEPETWIE